MYVVLNGRATPKTDSRYYVARANNRKCIKKEKRNIIHYLSSDGVAVVCDVVVYSKRSKNPHRTFVSSTLDNILYALCTYTQYRTLADLTLLKLTWHTGQNNIIAFALTPFMLHTLLRTFVFAVAISNANDSCNKNGRNERLKLDYFGLNF